MILHPAVIFIPLLHIYCIDMTVALSDNLVVKILKYLDRKLKPFFHQWKHNIQLSVKQAENKMNTDIRV